MCESLLRATFNAKNFLPCLQREFRPANVILRRGSCGHVWQPCASTASEFSPASRSSVWCLDATIIFILLSLRLLFFNRSLLFSLFLFIFNQRIVCQKNSALVLNSALSLNFSVLTIYVICIIFILLFFALFLNSNVMDENKVEFVSKVVACLKLFSLNDDVSLFIACQFALESNFGMSKLALENSNYCGMKKPMVRISTAKNAGVYDGQIFAEYLSFEHCVFDYVLWLQYQKPLRKCLDSVELFPSLLRTYCPENDYISKIQRIYSFFK